MLVRCRALLHDIRRWVCRGLRYALATRKKLPSRASIGLGTNDLRTSMGKAADSWIDDEMMCVMPMTMHNCFLMVSNNWNTNYSHHRSPQTIDRKYPRAFNAFQSNHDWPQLWLPTLCSLTWFYRRWHINYNESEKELFSKKFSFCVCVCANTCSHIRPNDNTTQQNSIDRLVRLWLPPAKSKQLNKQSLTRAGM